MDIDGWDIALIVVAGYLAVVALVRLMLRRRQQLWEEYQKQAEAEQAAREANAASAAKSGRRRSA